MPCALRRTRAKLTATRAPASRPRRDIWYHFTVPGTFRKLVRATADWCCGQGFDFEWPTPGSVLPAGAEAPAAVRDSWHVTEKDLAFFQQRAESDAPLPGASEWQIVLDKDVPNFVRYTAWRRTLPDGKTEYKSITIAPDATAREFMDFYLDDDFRPVWDGMITHHEVLETGDFSQRQQVVRWIRSFPFAFLSDREYTIARAMFDRGADLYGITKAVAHPAQLVRRSRATTMDVFWSMWRSRTVACPWGSGRPACETVLLHHEQFKIPENLARFAARHGMWGFVQNLSRKVPEFVAQRRKRCAPDAVDALAYGAKESKVAAEAAALAACGGGVISRVPSSASSLSRCASSASCRGAASRQDSWGTGASGRSSSSCSSCGGSEASSGEQGGSGGLRRTAKRVLVIAAAGAVAMVLNGLGGGTSSSSNDGSGNHHGSGHKPSAHHRHHRRHHRDSRAAADQVAAADS